MAILGVNNPTLADVAKATDKNGRITTIVELLKQSNPILTDMTMLECNDGTNHKSSVRVGLPQGIWRKLYQGVPSDKSQRVQVTDSTGMFEARAHVDKALADLNKNTAAFRLQEAQAFMESMNQSMAQTLFYENADANPERFTGLSPRYSELNPALAANAKNIIDGGGTGSDNTSIWLILWGPNTLHGIYPDTADAGAAGGLSHQDLGVDDVNDAQGNPFRAYKDLWQWKLGLTVRDWRYAVRIANIDVSNLVNDTSATDLVPAMIKAMHRIPMFGMGRAAFYCNRTVAQYLDLQALDRAQNTLESGNDTFGNPVTMCRKIPIRTVDALLNTEERVVAN